MLPVTRANLDHICCVCLLDIRSSVFTQQAYDVRKDPNISKNLKLTALITVLKNPINQKYITDYCRKVCETCLVKIQYSYSLREKIIASTTTLKELLQNNNLHEMDIEKLNFFCRICLNRQKDVKRLEIRHMNWLKNCTGIRFTSLIDNEVLRIKEGTNINEIAIVDDKHFPQHLCRCCLKKLKNVDDFRKSATQSFEYMITVMGDTINQEEHLVYPETPNEEHLELRSKIQSERIAEFGNIKQEKQERSIPNLFQNQRLECDIEPLINAEDFIQAENGTIQIVDCVSNYSHNSADQNVSGFGFSELEECGKSDDSFRKEQRKNSEQHETKELICKSNKEKSIENYKPIIKTLINSKEKLLCQNIKCSRSLRNSNVKKATREFLKNADNKTKEANVCEECSKEFSSKRSLRKHIRTVHKFDSAKMIECMLCLKKFKRKSHMDHHIKSVHEKLKPFKCSYCAKTFTAKSTKRVHELSHTGDFPFICNFCGKGFRRSNQLKIHLDIHTTIPELLCPICKRSQSSKADLENHLKIHSDKRVQCTICGKFFSRNFHLIDHHNAVHLKLRPFKCKYCELAFGDRKTRRTHEKLHTEERALKCSLCSMGFKNQIGLTKHIKDVGHIPGPS